jgi:hypothetical protein
MAEKKDKRNPEHSGAFIVASILLVAIIFFILYLKYQLNNTFIATIIKNINSTMNEESESSTKLKKFGINAGIALLILGSIYGILLAISAIIGEPINAIGKLSSVALIGGILMILTMLTLNYFPLLYRVFENTFGYAFINKGGSLNTITKNIFTANNYGDLSIIATQFDVENFKSIMDTDNGPLKRFEGISLKPEFTKETNLTNLKPGMEQKDNPYIYPLYQMLEKIVDKRHVSETVWLSLVGILTMYGAYLI